MFGTRWAARYIQTSQRSNLARLLLVLVASASLLYLEVFDKDWYVSDDDSIAGTPLIDHGEHGLNHSNRDLKMSLHDQ